MTRHIPSLLILTVLATAVPASAAERGAVELLLVQSYHGDEISATSGETWLAVVPRDGAWEAVPTTIDVTIVEDPIVDRPGETTGKAVSAGGLEPLFLVRAENGLGAGPVETLVADPRRFERGAPIVLELANGRRWELGVRCPELPEPTPEERERGEFPAAWWEPCPLVLADGETEQPLGDVAASPMSDALPGVLWAGDFDRDGELDLLLELTDHYNMSLPTLFLSSYSGEGELVARVAELMMTGC